MVITSLDQVIRTVDTADVTDCYISSPDGKTKLEYLENVTKDQIKEAIQSNVGACQGRIRVGLSKDGYLFKSGEHGRIRRPYYFFIDGTSSTSGGSLPALSMSGGDYMERYYEQKLTNDRMAFEADQDGQSKLMERGLDILQDLVRNAKEAPQPAQPIGAPAIDPILSNLLNDWEKGDPDYIGTIRGIVNFMSVDPDNYAKYMTMLKGG